MSLCIPTKVLDQHLVVLGKTGAGKLLSLWLPPVIGLLFRRGPSAIVGRIWTIIVRETVQRMSWARSLAHIFEKSLETVLPTRANGYASVCIIFSIWGLWVKTSVFHTLPCMIFSGLAHPMSAVRNRCALTLKAATGKYFNAKMVLPNHSNIATIASAFPKSMPQISRRFITHNESPESHACYYHTHIKNDNLWGYV